jgi:peptide subunit release factor RF-3
MVERLDRLTQVVDLGARLLDISGAINGADAVQDRPVELADEILVLLRVASCPIRSWPVYYGLSTTAHRSNRDPILLLFEEFKRVQMAI